MAVLWLESTLFQLCRVPKFAYLVIQPVSTLQLLCQDNFLNLVPCNSSVECLKFPIFVEHLLFNLFFSLLSFDFTFCCGFRRVFSLPDSGIASISQCFISSGLNVALRL